MQRREPLPTWVFWATLGCLCVLPIAPEMTLWLRHYDDLKAFSSIAYYELIVSALLWWPALLLPPTPRQWWVVAIAALTGIATLLTGFQAVSVGARWDTTTHAALLETNPYEAWGFVHAFATLPVCAWLLAIAIAFAAFATAHLRASRPPLRTRWLVIGGAALFSAYGVRNAVVYGGNPIHESRVSADVTLRLIEPGVNAYHPVLRLAVTHWNHEATHAYRAKVLREMERHLGELRGATVIPGATPPRIFLLVIGESASRRHWSLYGYHRDTNPQLTALGRELLVFSDTVCHTVGTLTEIQGMLCAPGSYLPVLSLFSAAGYKTHWFSAQLDQGPNDVKLAALVQRCDEKVFLNGSYDENLVPLVQHTVAQPGKHFIVVNLFGSHVRYDDRYPRTFATFSGTGEKEHRLAAYDNSIRYTDSVLAQLIHVLREQSDPACFVYVSDHAEDVYDSDPEHYLFRSDSVATNAMYEVPFVMWFSPEYVHGNPDIVQSARQAEPLPFQTLGLYHTLVDLARLRHPIYNPNMSVVSPLYIQRDRLVGVMNRVYHRDPPAAPDAGRAASAAPGGPSQ